MKKLVVLALVLSMATMASATLVVRSSADTLLADETATITVNTADLIAPAVGEGFWVVAVNITGGALSNPANLFIADSGVAVVGLIADGGIAIEGADGYFGGIALGTVASIDAGTDLFSFTFTKAAGDATVSVYSADPETGTLTLFNSVVITPEPMTMCLLGLGGLFLRRRSK